jgi:Fic family protein
MSDLWKMLPQEFMAEAPGRLVPTEGPERYRDGASWATRMVETVSFVPEPLPPPLAAGALLEAVGDVLGAAQHALGHLSGLVAFAREVEVARVLASPLMRRESTMSSRIEGTHASPADVAMYEGGQPPLGRDTIEVANYRKALRHGLESDLPLGTRLVCEMHEILLDGVGEGKGPGQVRETQNWIGGSGDIRAARFVPPPPGNELAACLEALEMFWGDRSSALPPLVAIAMAHYQFETIHPFIDGNGRLGRLVIVLSLVRQGLLPLPLLHVSAFFERHRREYADLLLAVSREGAWSSWIRFFVTGVAEQAQDAASRLVRIRDERDRALAALSERRTPAKVPALIDRFIGSLTGSAAQVAAWASVSLPTARDYISRLEEVDFLREMTGGDYGRVWGAGHIIDIIEEE